MPAANFLEAGALANADQFASITASTVSGGAAHGCRALDLRVMGGMDVRLLPDRGLDVGAAWFAGIPLAWISMVGERSPVPSRGGEEWIEAFGGGLFVTCGLQNVGLASEGHGQHGRYSLLPARDVAVSRTLEGGEMVLTATGTIEEVSALGPHLRLERTLRTRTGAGLLELTDVTTNLGTEPEAGPLLYHCNLGVPLSEEGARVEIDSEQVIPRDANAERGLDSWMVRGGPIPAAREIVFEHVVRPDASGWGVATLVNERLGLAFHVRWEQRELPRFHQWVHPASGIYALGLEPANCSIQGRAAERAAGTLPMLLPNQPRTTRLQLSVEWIR